VTETLYDGSSNVTQVNYGSHSGSDNDTFSYDPNTERPTGWTINVDAVNNLSYQATITNGTVKGLNITDGFYSADSQTCTFTYDDLSRLLTHNCGTVWGAAYSYDAYGNISKGMISGSPGTTFAPTYAAATNRFATIPSGTLSYDSAGNLTSDGFHTYGWDSDGNLISVGGVAGKFDALDRRVEVDISGTYEQMLYPPFAPTYQLSLAQGLTAENIRIPLPGGGQAIYNSGGLAQYRHPNWQGSEVVLSWPGGTPNPNVGGAFTAFGEKYATYPGGHNGYFAGMLGIADEGSIADAYQATARLYHQDEGRWVSPDPAGLSAVDLSNPQTMNRYVYVANNPLSNTDPSGLISPMPPGIGPPGACDYILPGDAPGPCTGLNQISWNLYQPCNFLTLLTDGGPLTACQYGGAIFFGPNSGGGPSGGGPAAMLAYLKACEGHSIHGYGAYNDSLQNCTTGFGQFLHFGACSASDITAYQGETEAEAEAKLQADYDAAMAWVQQNTSYLTQNQQDALVDLYFNMGPGTPGGKHGLLNHDVWTTLTNGNLDQISPAIMSLTAGGRGIIPRRAAEVQMFVNGVYSPTCGK
jgi:RHS repeat-associated protein